MCISGEGQVQEQLFHGEFVLPVLHFLPSSTGEWIAEILWVHKVSHFSIVVENKADLRILVHLRILLTAN